jgi:hypothetical protein
LSAAERAALADLEAAASAADPILAARLRGRSSRGIPEFLLTVVTLGLLVGREVIGAGLWGLVPLVGGLALTVLGLSVSIALSVVGVLIMATGMGMLACYADRRWFAAVPPDED